METLLMVLVICVFVRAAEECAGPKTRQEESHFVKVSCNKTSDEERDFLETQSICGEPKYIYYNLNVGIASYEEVYPAAVMVKRCIGSCNSEGDGYDCIGVQSSSRDIPVKIANIKTSKEWCGLFPVIDHEMCECQGRI